jgi:hypothetical protein
MRILSYCGKRRNVDELAVLLVIKTSIKPLRAPSATPGYSRNTPKNGRGTPSTGSIFYPSCLLTQKTTKKALYFIGFFGSIVFVLNIFSLITNSIFCVFT